jgi:hypothetical protein
MTAEEEPLFRAAARQALERSNEVVLVAAADPESAPAFSLVTFENSVTVGIIIPEAWESVEGAEDQCQAILRQESKALAGQALD